VRLLAVAVATAALGVGLVVTMRRTTSPVLVGGGNEPNSVEGVLAKYVQESQEGLVSLGGWAQTLESAIGTSREGAPGRRRAQRALVGIYNSMDRVEGAFALAESLMASSQTELEALNWLGECMEIAHKARILGREDLVGPISPLIVGFQGSALPVLRAGTPLFDELQYKVIKAAVLSKDCRQLADWGKTKDYLKEVLRGAGDGRLTCRTMGAEDISRSAFRLGLRFADLKWAEALLPEVVSGFERRGLHPARGLSLLVRDRAERKSLYGVVGDWLLSQEMDYYYCRLADEVAGAVWEWDQGFAERAWWGVLHWGAEEETGDQPIEDRGRRLVERSANHLARLYQTQGRPALVEQVKEFAKACSFSD
jgi:hypothetical protein